jgi:TRAP-type C4-dicarboxylate transport system permease small subunit
MLGHALLGLQKGIMIVCSIVVAVGISIAAVLRYVFRTDLYGSEEIIVIFAYWLYFAGGAFGAYERSHITADVVSVYVKNPRLKAALACFSSLCTFGLSTLFAWWGWHMFAWGLEKGGATPVWRIPLVIPQSAIFFGLVLMSVYFAGNVLEDGKVLAAAWRKDPEHLRGAGE